MCRPAGLTTTVMPAGDVGLEIEFDFVDHVLDLLTSDGRRRPGVARAAVCRELLPGDRGRVAGLGVEVTIVPRPSEVVEAIRFPDDEVHRSYDADAAHRFWLVFCKPTA